MSDGAAEGARGDRTDDAGTPSVITEHSVSITEHCDTRAGMQGWEQTGGARRALERWRRAYTGHRRRTSRAGERETRDERPRGKEIDLRGRGEEGGDGPIRGELWGRKKEKGKGTGARRRGDGRASLSSESSGS